MTEIMMDGMPARFWVFVDQGLMTEADARARYATEAPAETVQDDGPTAALSEAVRSLMLEVDQVRRQNGELQQRVASLEGIARRTGALGVAA